MSISALKALIQEDLGPPDTTATAHSYVPVYFLGKSNCSSFDDDS